MSKADGETNQLGSIFEILIEQVFRALADQPLALDPVNGLCSLFSQSAGHYARNLSRSGAVPADIGQFPGIGVVWGRFFIPCCASMAASA